MQFVQLYGLKEMYLKHPDKSWYYIVGCDTYLHPDYVRNMLESFDASEALSNPNPKTNPKP